MARLFDSDSPPPVLTFAENVECPGCGEIFEGLFTDYTASPSVEDLTEPPLGRHECPECGLGFASAMTGWMFFTEAG
jgi:uncharacterized protein (UPF0212 family)